MRIHTSYEPRGLNYVLTIKEHVSDDMIIVTNVDATHHGSLARFVNHSCQPNCTIVMIRDKNSVVGIPCLMSLRIIARSEQLTFDYSCGQDNDNNNNNDDNHNNYPKKRIRSYKYFESKTQCLCNSNNCRGWLSGYH